LRLGIEDSIQVNNLDLVLEVHDGSGIHDPCDNTEESDGSKEDLSCFEQEDGSLEMQQSTRAYSSTQERQEARRTGSLFLFLATD
jgi:hypothetical protein